MNEGVLFQRLLKQVERYYAQHRQGRFLDYLSPEELADVLDLDREATGDWQAVLDWVERYLRHSPKTGHPDFLNRMWSGANLPSIIGEFVTALVNTSACTYESAPVSTLMEHYMLDTMLDLVGFEQGEGQMTTGSSAGNLIAMLTARNEAVENCKQDGLYQQRPLIAFVSEEAHYSLDKAANLLGLGTRHLVKIPVDEWGRMRADALEQALRRVHQQGSQPFFVCATLGTTVRGAYDLIAPLLKLREQHGFWLHGDGAWGGVALLDDELRQRFLPDVEQLDSFTWDFHKMPGTNLACSMLLLNHRKGSLRCACSSGEHSYLFREEDESAKLDTGIASLQCGRKVDSLKWFLDWKFHGKSGFGERTRRYLQLAEHAERFIRQHPELELTAPRYSFNVCFRYIGNGRKDLNTFNLELRNRMLKSGRAAIGVAYIGDRLTLRLLITHPEFDTAAVDRFFTLLLEVAREISDID